MTSWISKLPDDYDLGIEHIEKINECNFCGSKENLLFHHVSYDPEIIQVLCKSCHIKEEHRGQLFLPLSTIGKN